MEKLTAIHDGRKSFGGKATFEKTGNKIKLYSYNTLVATLEDEKFTIRNVPMVFSDTSLRHIREFYKQFVENKPMTKDELRKFLV